MKKYWLKNTLFIVHFSLLILLWGCFGNKDISDAYGTFESTEITVSAEGVGKILRFDIEEGQILKKNELIGIIDTTDLILKKQQTIAQRDALMATRDNICLRLMCKNSRRRIFL